MSKTPKPAPQSLTVVEVNERIAAARAARGPVEEQLRAAAYALSSTFIAKGTCKPDLQVTGTWGFFGHVADGSAEEILRCFARAYNVCVSFRSFSVLLPPCWHRNAARPRPGTVVDSAYASADYATGIHAWCGAEENISRVNRPSLAQYVTRATAVSRSSSRRYSPKFGRPVRRIRRSPSG